jgi:cell division protein ZapD
MITFEFPLNERIRRLLRIEEIYQKFEHQLKNTHDYFEFSCFNTLFEIVQLVSRSDLKIDFLQELERQEKKQSVLLDHQGLKEGQLDPKEIISMIQVARKKLENIDVKPGFNFNNNLFLEEVKKRISSPGGLLDVDFPSFRNWSIQKTRKSKLEDFKTWAQPLMVFRDAASVILLILRNQCQVESIKAKEGKHQQTIDPLKTYDLIRLELENALNIYPEISANKYTVNVFFNQLNEELKKEPVKANLEFKYNICWL